MNIGSKIKILPGAGKTLNNRRAVIIGTSAELPVLGHLYILLLEQPLEDGTSGVVLPENLLREIYEV